MSVLPLCPKNSVLFQSCYEKDFERMDHLIASIIESDEIPLIRNLAHHILSLRGKRIRPLLALVSAQVCGYTGDQHIPLAASLELMHTATLLHDDVVDESQKRRGQDCAHTLWGNKAAILVGDFLLSQSFQMIVNLGHPDILYSFSHAAATISQGEIAQLEYSYDPYLTLEQYLNIVTCKTGALLAAACEAGALLTHQPLEVVQLFKDFGAHLGCIFQMTDDLLDYEHQPSQWGKNCGDDFLEGKVTLPFIVALAQSNATQKEALIRAIEKKTPEALRETISILNATNSFHMARNHISYIHEKAMSLVNRLSRIFSDTHQLKALVDFCARRAY